MMLARTPHAARRGVILLVVLTLVALFAVVALSFALFGESQALWSRHNREAVATNDDPPDAAAFASQFLGRVLYPMDTQNITTYGTADAALLNGLRGYDMATMVYGYNPSGGNTVPYNGIGTVFEDLSNPATNSAATLAAPTGITDRRQVINYSWQFDRSGGGVNRVFDPEFLGLRSNKSVPPTSTWVGRNAPYTYPDRNNVYVAVQDPATGRILKVSYVSPHFNGGTMTLPDVPPKADRRLAPPMSVSAGSNNGITNPNNDDWLNAAGRYKTIRPRPTDHTFNSGDGRGAVSDFPFISPNPDGTYTGDVQNIINTDGVQKNNAVWVNAGLPVRPWRGKNVIALVAPTILPLDGRVNVNVASKAGTTGANGFGPWEIALSQVLTNNAAAVVQSRYGGSSSTPTPPGLTSGAFKYSFPAGSGSAGSSPQAANLVDWNASATQKPFLPGDTNDPDAMMMMGGSLLKSNVTYPHTSTPFTPTQYGEAGENTSHPGSFNPYTWAGTNPRQLFPFIDLRRSAIKYSERSSNDYLNPFYGSTAPTDLTGTGPGSGSNAARTLVTTASNSLARAGLLPNFRDYLTTNRTVEYAGGVLSVQYPTPALADVDRTLQAPFASAPTGSPNTAWVTDYNTSSATTATIDRYRAAAAGLGALDINRPLTDYRTNTSASLADPSNAGMAMLARTAQANADRVQLAREIFARLILAVGAKAQVTAPVVGPASITLPVPAMGAYTLTTTAGATTTVKQEEYDALRYLAQIAINIVEYVDNDDVITAFPWNPNDANDIVYGVEKPRLIINEVYSETTNDPANMTGPFQVKFWAELLNTSNNDVSGSPLAGPSTATAGSVPLQLNGTGVYQIEIYRQGAAAFSQMAASPRGDASGAMFTPDIRVDATTLTSTAGSNQYVEPNNGSPTATTTSRNGIAVVGPKPPTTPGTNDYNPTSHPAGATMLAGPGNPTDPTGGMAGPSPDMAYTEKFGMNSPTDTTNHTVLLRRLQNPYIPYDMVNNVYVTVDYMRYVRSWNAVQNVQGGMPNQTIPNPTAPTPLNQRSSIGRVQPYCGQEVVGTAPALQSYPASHVVPQKNTPAMPMATQPQVSLFQHNTSQDLSMSAGMGMGAAFVQNPDPQQQLLQPFEWLVHLDRPLVNQLELLHVAACRNHDVTHSFTSPNAAGTPTFHQHTAFFSTLNGTSQVPLYRALELLAVKPWGYGLPAGGRVPGKININMIWNSAILNALASPSAATPSTGPNAFTAADVSGPTGLYNTLIGGTSSDTSQVGAGFQPAARTKNIAEVGPTFDEVGPTYTDGTVTRGSDRPFKPFGVASFSAPTVAPTPPTLSLYPNGSGVQDTLLRDANPTAPTGTPAVFNNTGLTHPYQKAELLRKLYNNITTTSDTYLVVMTVSYFEVRNNAPYDTANPVVLGKELFSEVPGDLRKKFVAVIDRSMIAQDTAAASQQATDFWETDLTAFTGNSIANQFVMQFHATEAVRDTAGNVTELAVYYEGRRFSIKPGSTLVVGTGANAEVVTVLPSQKVMPPATNILGGDADGNNDAEINGFDPNTGIATVMVLSTSGRSHVSGERLGVAQHGNPGPQPNFDVNSPQYKGVVPFFEAVTTTR